MNVLTAYCTSAEILMKVNYNLSTLKKNQEINMLANLIIISDINGLTINALMPITGNVMS